MSISTKLSGVAADAIGLLGASQLAAQMPSTQAPPAPAGAAPAPRAAPENWWVEKAQGGVYNAPMRPLWKLADLKKMHPGQNNWSEQIIKDPEQEATYNSAAPGSKFDPRMHPDTPTMFVVIAGEVNFHVEGQPDLKAVRGSLVNILKTTVYSYDVSGTQNALWVEVDPRNYKTVYPAANAAPKAMAGGQVIKIAFAHTPDKYTGVNQLHWNLFEAIAKCDSPGAKIWEDHLFANPLVQYKNPADNKCAAARPPAAGGGAGGAGNGAPAAPAAFNPKSTFGHMHAGPAEWWIVQVGKISGKFENVGEIHAEEGDVLYAAPMTWHQMGLEGETGPSVRLALGGYNLINMNNTAAAGQ